MRRRLNTLLICLISFSVFSQGEIINSPVDSIRKHSLLIKNQSDSIFSMIESDKQALQVNSKHLTETNLIGLWEFDYNANAEICGCGDKNVNYKYYRFRYGKATIELVNDSNFKMATWGMKSSGNFHLNKDTLFFNHTIGDQIGNDRWIIESITNERMNVKFVECDAWNHWTYRRKKK